MTVNGQALTAVTDATIETTAFLAADRFSVTGALSAASPAIWSSAPLLVEIDVSLGGQSARLIAGNADALSVDPIAGTFRLAGRDLTSLFIDSQIDQSFENQTSSDIASLLANRRGLIANVTATRGAVGRYYKNDRTRTALTQHAQVTTEWDLLCSLAQLEGFDLWVAGRSLYFQPASTDAVAMTLSPELCISLAMHHALDVAAGVAVTVKSWDSATQTQIIQTASNAIGDQPARRIVVRPNLSAADAQSLADRLVSQITAHERVLHIEMPGDLTTMPRMTMALTGTGTDFDGVYDILSVERGISFTRGFTQSIEARSVPWTAS